MTFIIIFVKNTNLATEAESMETRIVTCTEVLFAKEEKGLLENIQRKNKKKYTAPINL